MKNENTKDIISKIAQPITAAELVAAPAPGEQPGSEIGSQAAAPEAKPPENVQGDTQPAQVISAPGQEQVNQEAQPISAEQLVTGALPPPPGDQPAQEKKRGRGRPKLPRDEHGNPIHQPKEPETASIIAEPIAATAVPGTDYKMLSGVCFDTSTAVLSMILGPEWNPQNAQERDAVIAALIPYLQSKQVQDIPPGILLAIVCASYAAPRLKAQPTSNKIKAAWFWFRSRLSRKKKVVTAPANVVNPFAEQK